MNATFPDGQLRSAKNFLDWIGPALMRHSGNLFGDTLSVGLDLPDSSSTWQVVIHETLSSEVQTELFLEPIPIVEEQLLSIAQLEMDVNNRLSWEYPHSQAVNQSAKTSVSELKRRFPWYTDSEQMNQPQHPEISLEPISTEEESAQDSIEGTHSKASASLAHEYVRPKFLQTNKELNPAERGIALHTVMQHLPLDTWRSLWDHLPSQDKEYHVLELLESLVNREVLTEEQARVVSVSAVLSLLNSPTGTRLLTGGEVRREVPFTLSIQLKNQSEPVLVQGVIDAIILSQKEGIAEVLDFKTDYLLSEMEPEKILSERYALQLALYSYAVEKLLKVSVHQCTIYSTSLNREFILPQEVMQARLVHIIK
jgi:ATP-dependent helicase/nuclease subunit A